MLLNAFHVRTVSKCENGITARAFLSEWNSLAHILKCYSIVVYLRIVLYINSSNTCCCNFHCFHASLEQGLYMLQHVPRRAVHFSFSRLVDKDLCLFSHRMHSIWNVVRQYWRSDCDSDCKAQPHIEYILDDTCNFFPLKTLSYIDSYEKKLKKGTDPYDRM